MTVKPLILPAAAVAVIANLFASVTAPYMDEELHVAQAKQFCQGHFELDPKITTPPGLYHTSSYIAWITALVGVDACSLTALRALNAVYSVASFGLIAGLLSRADSVQTMHGPAGVKPLPHILHTLVVWLLPFSFFFSFLYYTDVGALFWLLLVASLAPADIRDRFKLSRWIITLAASYVAVSYRQTSAVWLAFIGAATLVPAIGHRLTVTRNPFAILHFSLHLVVAYAFRLAAFFLPGVQLAYNVWNAGGVVVHGDAAHHQPVLHTAQLFYLLLILAAYCLPDVLLAIGGSTTPLITRWRGHLKSLFFVSELQMVTETDPAVLKQLASEEEAAAAAPAPASSKGKKGKAAAAAPAATASARRTASSYKRVVEVSRLNIQSVLAFVALSVLVTSALQVGTYSHPFLLSDNRHYTFYLWQRFLSHQADVLMLLAVAYTLAAVLVSTRWVAAFERPTHGLVWFTLWLAASAATLVPAQLLEPRYFIVPVTMALLRMRQSSNTSLAMLVAASLLVNGATIYTFLYQPFTDAAGKLQRFMW